MIYVTNIRGGVGGQDSWVFREMIQYCNRPESKITNYPVYCLDNIMVPQTFKFGYLIFPDKRDVGLFKIKFPKAVIYSIDIGLDTDSDSASGILAFRQYLDRIQEEYDDVDGHLLPTGSAWRGLGSGINADAHYAIAVVGDSLGPGRQPLGYIGDDVIQGEFKKERRPEDYPAILLSRGLGHVFKRSLVTALLKQRWIGRNESESENDLGGQHNNNKDYLDIDKFIIEFRVFGT